MRVTRTGEVTIPPQIMEEAGLAPGAEVEWRVDADGVARLMRVGDGKPDAEELAAFSAWLDSIRGKATGGLTTDEIMAMTRGE